MTRNERSAGFIAYHVAPSGGIEYLTLNYGRHWDFPKGHVESGEDDLAAAIRELREETGLTDPRVVPGFRHEIVYYFRDRRKGLIRKTVVFFLAEMSGRDVALSHEHVGFEFLPFEQALKRVTYPTAKAVLKAAHEHLSPAGSAHAAAGAAAGPTD